MEPNQILTPQKEQTLIARKNSYISYIEKYPLYSTLLVLKDYEDEELYEECAIIKNALDEYKTKYEKQLPKEVVFPTNITAYTGKQYQDMVRRCNIVVEEKVAKEKATLIKLHLPIK